MGVVAPAPKSGGRGRLQTSTLPHHAGRTVAGYCGLMPRAPASPLQLALLTSWPNPSLRGDTPQLEGQDVDVGFWDL